MPASRITISLVAWSATLLAWPAHAALDADTEALIDQLPQTSQIGHGYSAMFSGSQFLPDPDSSAVHTLVLGGQAPTNSAILERIVRRGILAVPSLLKHLDDSRETKIPPLSGIMWISFADEYDYNRRLRKDAPTGVNKDLPPASKPPSHTVTVGDLCFVALGQIVNRDFNATRYQPTGGLVVNSPTYSQVLCAVVRADFQDLSENKHRELLIQDLVMPDSEERRNGACKRLAFYYPETLEPLVLKQLAVPTYDIRTISDFLQKALPAHVTETRKAIFAEFVRTHGPAFSDGVLLRLFDGLDRQEADDARTLLVQLYGYTDAVSKTNKPYVKTWSTSEAARFIKASTGYKSRKVDEVVRGVLAGIRDDDYLARACMGRLIGNGYGVLQPRESSKTNTSLTY